ncbi:hypothetical protein A3G67_05150 [Candidatus Roizmanbacteria bacterium RIFCSPLOWO2_12_FULL_40_12]|nr:MAG: hypothetical protein A3G67_05150 [Candidatus Roizmanbacteria bacterium RIFCSPLOWO2_12_FULL_40_12]
MKLGAHVSIAGGHINALHKIKKMGGNCLQIFSASPRAWNFVRISDVEEKEFAKEKKKLAIDPVYFHASYLINLASDGRVGQLSTQLLTHELKVAKKMDVRGSIIHTGSHKDGDKETKKVLANIFKVLEKIPNDRLFIIENAGTRKIGLYLDEIGEIVKGLKSKNVKVCLDTCHLHAAGYNLRTKKSFKEFLEFFDSKIGLEKLELWHLNDSKDPFESFRDRHENIGKGEVGTEVFKNILTHAKTKNLPCIIEVPGFDDMGPDKKNLDILKALV